MQLEVTAKLNRLNLAETDKVRNLSALTQAMFVRVLSPPQLEVPKQIPLHKFKLRQRAPPLAPQAEAPSQKSHGSIMLYRFPTSSPS